MQLKMDDLQPPPESALGAGALPRGVSLDSTTSKSCLLNLEEPLATVSTTLTTRVVDEARLFIEFKGISQVVYYIEHLLLRQVRGLPLELLNYGWRLSKAGHGFLHRDRKLLLAV